MKRIATTLALLALLLLATTSLSASTPIEGLRERLRTHIEYLSSPELAGRSAGSEEGYKAADYIAAQFQEIGLVPFKRADYFHPFAATLEEGTFRNVVGSIEGTTPDSYIVIGAHYDHLGVKRDRVYPGADDNASGTAALIEVARLLAASNYRPKSTIVFAAFDAEEIGLYGSKEFARYFTAANTKVMLNMDMIGWLKEGALDVEGTGTLEGAEKLVESLGEQFSVAINAKRYENTPMVATDTEAFALKGIPTLSMTTGLHSAYHRPTDTSDKIDYQGVEKSTRFVAELARRVDSTNEMVATGKVASKHRSGINEFQWGIVYSFGDNHYNYPNTAFMGREAEAWSLGLNALYTLKWVGFRVGAAFNNYQALTPIDATDPFGDYTTIESYALTVPVEVMVKTPGRTSFYVTLGGYWSHNFLTSIGEDEEEVTYRPRELRMRSDEWGLQWGLGWRIYNFAVEVTNRHALTPAYEEISDMPLTLNQATYCTLGLYF